MAKLNSRKGKNRNKKQREAAELSKAAAELAEISRKRKRAAAEADGTSAKRHKHVPQKVGRGGKREKLDVDELDSPSRAQVERSRRNMAAHRLRKKGGGVTKVSQAVLDNPTEAWREKQKATGHVNKNPDDKSMPRCSVLQWQVFCVSCSVGKGPGMSGARGYKVLIVIDFFSLFRLTGAATRQPALLRKSQYSVPTGTQPTAVGCQYQAHSITDPRTRHCLHFNTATLVRSLLCTSLLRALWLDISSCGWITFVIAEQIAERSH